MRTVVFAHITTRCLCDLNLKRHAARQQSNLAGSHFQHAQFGDQHQRALLRHDQHFGVRIDESALRHRAVGQVHVRGHATLRIGVAVEHHGAHAVDKVQRLLAHCRHGQRGPAHGIGRCGHTVLRARFPEALRK